MHTGIAGSQPSTNMKTIIPLLLSMFLYEMSSDNRYAIAPTTNHVAIVTAIKVNTSLECFMTLVLDE